jgi:hypothetical protein
MIITSDSNLGFQWGNGFEGQSGGPEELNIMFSVADWQSLE